ncbi:hypothetical protein SY27_01500 [Flavobacterium sp. 316]|uniref:hypothetical protein n=1 Tax=Flavobacterium sp. 316 TaxID=1603293 RepID=UPI0005E29914|nr:hypothetical protein [Flavobacterium sp. 316]KIX22541.1 hypothetical protein SY27_01500 [Flavobacterium sp. 316]
MKKCPNNDSKNSNEVIGYYNKDGILIYLDSSSKSNLSRNNARLSATCETKECTNWTGKECSIPSKILNNIKNTIIYNSENCIIRDKCRWYYQEGIKICKVCPVIK